MRVYFKVEWYEAILELLCIFTSPTIGYLLSVAKKTIPLVLKFTVGTSLVVQWLRLHTPNAGGPGSIPGQGTRSHMQQLKILYAATKTWHIQISKYF